MSLLRKEGACVSVYQPLIISCVSTVCVNFSVMIIFLQVVRPVSATLMMKFTLDHVALSTGPLVRLVNYFKTNINTIAWH